MRDILRTLVSVLLGVTLSGGCGTEADGRPNGKGTTAAPTKAIPNALLGTWNFEQLGDQVCNEAGLCVPSIARREHLTLRRDAAFEYSLYAESNFPPCKLIGQAQGRGSARVTGSKLDLVVAEGFSKKQDSCGESFNNNEKGNTWTYKFELAKDGTLMLTNDQGTQIGPFKR